MEEHDDKQETYESGHGIEGSELCWALLLFCPACLLQFNGHVPWVAPPPETIERVHLFLVQQEMFMWSS